MYNYNLENRDRFNPKLFERDDDEIVEEVLNVIRACQRSQQFSIRLLDYKVIDDPIIINDILYEKEEESLKYKRKRDKNAENIYGFIQLKDTDMRMLEVEYFICANDGCERLTVHIALPKIVNGNCFRLSGNFYIPLYQIIDGITYNNTKSKSKHEFVTMKLMFSPIRIYRNKNTITTVDKLKLPCTVYDCNIFSKSTLAVKFILGRLGLQDTISFLGLQYVFINDSYDKQELEDMYVFNKGKIYIKVPKVIFDADVMTQSFIYTLTRSINKATLYEEIFTRDYWLKMLGKDFNKASVEKGLIVCESFEGTYDIATMKNILLPDEHKSNVYTLLRWCLREFGNLRSKDNLDLSTKKIRFAEYIASYYAMRLAKGLHRLTDIVAKDRLKIKDIQRAINTDAMVLIRSISSSKSNLRMYKDSVSDLDAFDSIKFTFKGVSGLGDTGMNGKNKRAATIPSSYKRIYPEYIGRLDLDTSGASDPGMSGVLCPYVDIENGRFTQDQEPLAWEDNYKEMVDEFRSIMGMKEVLQLKEKVMKEKETELISAIDESLNTFKTLMIPITMINNNPDERTPITFINGGEPRG